MSPSKSDDDWNIVEYNYLWMPIIGMYSNSPNATHVDMVDRFFHCDRQTWTLWFAYQRSVSQMLAVHCVGVYPSTKCKWEYGTCYLHAINTTEQKKTKFVRGMFHCRLHRCTDSITHSYNWLGSFRWYWRALFRCHRWILFETKKTNNL